MEAHQEGRDVIIMEEMKRHIKGKRTKRRRPSSTLTLTLASATSSSSSTGSENGDLANHNDFFQMPSTTTIEFTNILQNNYTNNDQDMADCLMLLAHGHRLPTPSSSKTVARPRSYVYECKTCDRGFASFQALGGHRASHNKPHRDVHEISKNRTSLLISPDKALSSNTSGSTQGPKVHECSICGSYFTSGQALGGHMRRHRSMTMTTTTIATTSNTSFGWHESKKHKTIISLDLNLPAPIENDLNETKNDFEANNQIIVFSTPSLVDCHF